ncbi:uncharacterized protein FFM5_02534 [Fusarium fujikuroi]|nr:uncharacterized protein FFM5_02534 [Fusarium fujikuroi]
MHFKGK